MSKQEFLHDQILSAKLLRYLTFNSSNILSYDALAKKIGLSGKSILSRYLSGKVLPKKENINLIMEYCKKNNIIEQLVKEQISIHRLEGELIVDATKLLSNTENLKLIAYLVKKFFFPTQKIDKIVTPEVDGLPVGYAFAFEYNVPCLYLRKERPIAVYDYISEPLLTTKSRQEFLYAPKKGFVKGENILIVDDIIRSGKTQKAIITMINKANSNINGIVSLISIGKLYKELIKEKSNILVIHEVPK